MPINEKPTQGLTALAGALLDLSWSEMADFAEAIANEVPHLIKSEKMDRDGMAALLHDFADSIDRSTRP